jgi:hypothetical protein
MCLARLFDSGGLWFPWALEMLATDVADTTWGASMLMAFRVSFVGWDRRVFLLFIFVLFFLTCFGVCQES